MSRIPFITYLYFLWLSRYNIPTIVITVHSNRVESSTISLQSRGEELTKHDTNISTGLKCTGSNYRIRHISFEVFTWAPYGDAVYICARFCHCTQQLFLNVHHLYNIISITGINTNKEILLQIYHRSPWQQKLHPRLSMFPLGMAPCNQYNCNDKTMGPDVGLFTLQVSERNRSFIVLHK